MIKAMNTKSGKIATMPKCALTSFGGLWIEYSPEVEKDVQKKIAEDIKNKHDEIVNTIDEPKKDEWNVVDQELKEPAIEKKPISTWTQKQLINYAKENSIDISKCDKDIDKLRKVVKAHLVK